MLKGILGLPFCTSYIGILTETGKWPAAERIQHSTFMFYHSIINSEECLVTDVVLEQEDKHYQNTFFQRISLTRKELRIDTWSRSVKGRKKSERKKLCKTRIRQAIVNKMKQQCLGTKLRFVRNDSWEVKEYIKKGTGLSIQSILRSRLNITEQRMKYKNKCGNDLLCPLCHKCADTTEHVKECHNIDFFHVDLLQTDNTCSGL